MSLSNIQEPNSKQLYCGNLNASGGIESSGDVTAIGSLIVKPTLDSGGSLAGNSSLSFSSNGGVSGTPWVSMANGLRFGHNSASAGIYMTAGDGSGSIAVQGNVTANNLPASRASYSWSGSGDTLTVLDANVQTGDHIHVTQTNPGTEATAKFSHVNNIVDGVSFDIVLEGANTSNDATGNYMIYRSPA